jgi:hypothetical protein
VAFNCKAGANTVTALSNNGSKTGGLNCIAEISNVNAIDQTVVLANAAQNNAPSITTQKSPSLVIAATAQNAGNVVNVTGPAVQIGSATATDGAVGTLIESGTGTFTIGFTSAGSSNAFVVFDLYQNSGTGGGTSASWLTVNLDNSLRGLRH